MKKKRWIPKVGERYWYIFLSDVLVTINSVRTLHDRDHQLKNCFRTKREALAAAKKIRKILEGK